MMGVENVAKSLVFLVGLGSDAEVLHLEIL